MRSILRSLVLAPVMIAAAALATNSAMAETTVNVPFSFTVAGKICPAGQYLVKEAPSRSFVTLLNKNGSVGFSWILGPGDGATGSHPFTLRFEQQDQNYTLDSAEYGSSETHRLDKKGPRSEHKYVRIVQG